jgi:type II secretory pathway pseudopilin PulG
MNPPSKNAAIGLTLVELLTVTGILAVLAVLATFASFRAAENGKKLQAMELFTRFQAGLALFEADYQKPPVPESKLQDGDDTLYGDPGGPYHNSILVAALLGNSKEFQYTGETLDTARMKQRLEKYADLPFKADKKGGVGPDGILYDPWGREIVVAVNGFKGQNRALEDFNNGKSDRRLHTAGLGEYTETKPSEQPYVFWSYGKDGKKGNGAPHYGDVVRYKGSDDVISW